MTDLVQAALQAHGGLEHWRGIHSIDLSLNFSGAMLERKGFPRHLRPSCSIDIDSGRVTFETLTGAPEDQWIFTADRVWSEQPDGTMIEDWSHPLDAFAGHTLETKWETGHLTYFFGYSLWNYFSTPFFLIGEGYATRELDEHAENGETWRVLEVTFPEGVPTHSKVQSFYFGPDLLLRRVDYTVDVIKGTASNYCFDHKTFSGIDVPTVRRVVRRTEKGADVSGPTLFLLDYTDVKVY